MSSNQTRPDFQPLRNRMRELEMELWQWSNAARVDDIAGLANKTAEQANTIEFATLAERKRATIHPELAALAWVLDYFSHEPPPPPQPTRAPLSPVTAAIIFAIWFGALAIIYLGLLITQH